MSLAVNKYANALLEIAVEENCLDEIHADFKVFYDAICDNSDFEKLLVMDTIQTISKKDMIDRIAPNGNKLFLNFIKLIIDKDREFELKLIYVRFNELYKELKNIMEATAVTAVELTKEELDSIKSKLEKKYKKTIVLDSNVDPSILGGMILYVGDSVIDISLKARLAGLKNTMKQIKLT